MSTSAKLLTAAVLLLRAVTAVPAPDPTPGLELRAEPTDAWVSVDTTGLPSTVTPVVTVSDGTPTTLSAIPTELTATLLTKTEYGELTTSTGTTAAQPTATNKKGAGSFLRCSNSDGDYSPFCEPAKNSSLYPGTTYYVTWDPTAVNSTRVTIAGTYINSTTGETGENAFTSDDIKTSWSYYAWTPNKGYLSHGNGNAVNITLTLKELATDDETVTRNYTGPTVLVTKSPTYHQAAPTMPKGAALYIGLPVIFGFCLIMICGVCMWNRRSRQVDRIGLSKLLSRGRRGYGAAKSRAKRMTMSMRGGRKKQQAMHNLRTLDNVPEEQMYRDDPQQKYDGRKEYHYDYDADATEVRMGNANRDRDSDMLGSLAGTPTSEHFPTQQTQQGGNVFREEMERQNKNKVDCIAGVRLSTYSKGT